MRMPKPVGPNMATATPLGSQGAQTAQKQRAGSLELDAQPSAARIRLPEGTARKTSASVRRAYSRDTSAASGPEPGTRKDPDPRRRSSRGSGRRSEQACPAMRLRNACDLSRLNDFLALWSQAHLPSCNRQVSTASVHQAELGPATASRGHAPLQAGTLSSTRAISDRLIHG
jgi:hypothetical protein